jgi:hypothetical protein
MYPFFTQITKEIQFKSNIRKSEQDIQFKSKHQLYP